MPIKRSHDREWMDDLSVEGTILDRTLLELDAINRLLGGNHVSLQALSRLLKNEEKRVLSIADLGCGSGDLLKRLARHSEKQGFPATGIGIDANPAVVQFAQEYNGNQRLTFEKIDVLSGELPDTDVFHCSLFLHHFEARQIRELVDKMQSKCRIGIIINDLHRHPLAYHSIRLMTQLFSTSDMVKMDAPISVKRGFVREDWKKILSGYEYFLCWKWAFRWQVVIPKSMP